ncbi:hypothetical protein ARALYDRAFT_493361 [Arabidopsis lyrata subsp. lyrata]|uniref:Glycosyltransferase n=1 Tax=Arabidopsis lyrata subsp. lyrata TaxID=81972 RepID=D7MAK1_ARALL|nr:hypothetical protein ARALYDRAFT_493361 [Arabidopsis lyrata subsp. lyrata]
MKNELVFIPSPGIGHLRSTVELAKRLVGSNYRLSITVIIIPYPSDDDSETTYIASLTTASQDRLNYEAISVAYQPTADPEPLQVYIEKQKPQVRDVVARIFDSTRVDSRRLSGFVVDMFCSSMIDVANEFEVPCYMVYTSNATFLGISFHLQQMYDEKKYDVSELEDSVNELEFPCLTRPYPVKLNTVAELEPQAVKMFNNGDDLPQVYPVGPVLHLEKTFDDVEKQSDILRWLDEQPPKSVVFLCFGSMGGFNEEQTREIAVALDRNGYRFLWSLRRASPNFLTERPGDYTNLEEVLPEGFLDRTLDRGKIIGWAPQVAVLEKPAIGGFVTHCGWNSMLESLCTLRGDLLAGEMEIATAEDIERAIGRVMEQDSEVRIRVKEMAEKCHVALMDGGSSQVALQTFIQDVTENLV